LAKSKTVFDKFSYLFSSFSNTQTLIFLVCLLVALLFWFLKALDDTYTTQISVALELRHHPANQVLQDEPPDQVSLQVEGTGWNLLNLKTSASSYGFIIDLKEVTNTNSTIQLNQNAPYLKKHLPTGLEIQNILPAVIDVNFDQKDAKQIPVHLNGDITYAPQYGISDSISLQPRKVSISGPKQLIQDIDHVKTKAFSWHDLKATKEKHMPLKRKNTPNINYSHHKVQLTVPVNQITEGTFQIPVDVRSKVPEYKITIIPSKVKVVYQTTLNHFESIDTSDFQLYVEDQDFDTTLSYPQKLPVRVSQKPAFLNHFKIMPDRLNFLIKQ